jgi:hypothetical protein
VSDLDTIPRNETALTWCDEHGLRLDMLTPEDLLVELRTFFLDRDIVASGYDLSEAPF